jgi:AcrR family transcriptional regulator
MLSQEVEPSLVRERGRPRNVEHDRRVLEAVRELLAEDGYHSLSINKVTQRSGVHVRTITRRWPTRVEMVAAAIFGGDNSLQEGSATGFPSGRLESDLRELVERNLAYLSDRSIRAALPAILNEVADDTRALNLMLDREREWETTINLVLERAVESGDAPGSIFERSHLLPMILGSVTFLSQFQPWTSSATSLVDDLTEFVLAALRSN